MVALLSNTCFYSLKKRNDQITISGMGKMCSIHSTLKHFFCSYISLKQVKISTTFTETINIFHTPWYFCTFVACQSLLAQSVPVPASDVVRQELLHKGFLLCPKWQVNRPQLSTPPQQHQAPVHPWSAALK